MERTTDHLTPLEMVVNILPFSPIPLVTRLPHLLEDVKNPPGRADFLIPGAEPGEETAPPGAGETYLRTLPAQCQ